MKRNSHLHSIIIVLFLVLSNQAFAQWNTYFDLTTQRDSLPHFRELSFINPQNGVAACFNHKAPAVGPQFNGGSLVLTVDSGKTWKTQVVLDSMRFEDVKYITINKIIASAKSHYFDSTTTNQGAIAISNDGGHSWSVNYFPMRLGKLSVLNDSIILVAAHAVLAANQYSNFMVSRDYGASWTVLPSNYPNEEITDVLFFDDSLGFASSATGRLLKTVNQGISWDSLPLAWTSRTYIENLSSPDSVNLFFNSEAAFQEIYHSSDTGATWSRIGQFMSAQLLVKAEFLTDSIGFYFGSNIFKTIDQGASWTYTTLYGGLSTPFSTCTQFFTEDLIYMGGLNSFIRTSNGGDTTILTGITENAKGAAQPSLYPNPTKGVVNISYTEGLDRVEVYDVTGASVSRFTQKRTSSGFDGSSRYNVANATLLDDQSKKYRDAFLVDLTNQPNGIYLLKLTMQNGEVITKKVVKQ